MMGSILKEVSINKTFIRNGKNKSGKRYKMILRGGYFGGKPIYEETPEEHKERLKEDT